jgi:hypothetical protein
MIGLFFVVLNVVFADIVLYLNKNGDGVKVRLDGNPYDPFYWINKIVAEQCKAYPTTHETRNCWWIGSGQKGCHSYAPDFRLDAISNINKTSCGDEGVAGCIQKIVDANLCAYTFWKDPVLMLFCIVFIIIPIVFLIVFSIYKCYKCWLARRTYRDYHHPIENNNIGNFAE